ncbi:MAG: hypothetical protein GY850_41955 [bacterium]|nr:hypothetical protein [bacterium]
MRSYALETLYTPFLSLMTALNPSQNLLPIPSQTVLHCYVGLYLATGPDLMFCKDLDHKGE